MALRIGQILNGRNGTYRIIEVLKNSTVFKAQVLPGSSIPATYTAVKTEIGPEKICLKRELNNYQLPAIASSPFIRKLYDIVGQNEKTNLESNESNIVNAFCLVFERMDCDLWALPPGPFRENSILPKIVARSALSALAVLKTEYNAIHTDVNPNNILLSGIDGPSPQVKIGDLGNTLREGYNKIRVQSLPTRAPEVWRGLGCWHSSDVWSVGVTLAHWLAGYPIFGAKDKIVEGLAEAWCIAKIRRLVGPLNPPVDNIGYQEEFLVAEHLETSSFTHPDTKLETPFIKIGKLRDELEKLPGPKICAELLDFIEYLLVLDHEKRPTALEALQHPYLDFA